ncbi:hypothetical protein BC830DRAFT_1099348 [Chytriomyces sp. MP71]|nr:hypothetical protein BC830DRAFT_1099348 [Chytriomyces sp. MP71]
MPASAITLHSDFGYVIGVGALSVLYPFVLGGQVGGQRKKAKVPYPFMYASQAECAEDRNKLTFNCYQRAHQNYLENFPGFLFLLASAGLEHPQVAAAVGLLWLFGRWRYASNYQKGDPSKRNGNGAAVHYLALLTLLGLAGKTAVVHALGL